VTVAEKSHQVSRNDDSLPLSAEVETSTPSSDVVSLSMTVAETVDNSLSVPDTETSPKQVDNSAKDLPAVQCEPDAEDPDGVFVAPVRSSVLSRQVGAVLPSVGRRVPVPRSVLDPSVPAFRPRLDRVSSSSGMIHPSVNVSRPPISSCAPPVEQDNILLKTRVGSASIFSMDSTDLSVLPHFQTLFDQSVKQGDLTLPHQRDLAALMRRHSNVFATGLMDLGFCDVLEHDIDTGDAEPIRQPPRRPPFSARQAEEDILNEMLETGVI